MWIIIGILSFIVGMLWADKNLIYRHMVELEGRVAALEDWGRSVTLPGRDK